MEPKKLGDAILDQLRSQGIDLDALTGDEGTPDELKVVAIGADLSDSLRELGECSRDKVLMLRVDQDSVNQLDAWVEAGAARSRSEAGALFLKEGLKVRAKELDELSEALKTVDAAKRDLREKARQLLGPAGGEEEAS